MIATKSSIHLAPRFSRGWLMVLREFIADETVECFDFYVDHCGAYRRGASGHFERITPGGWQTVTNSEGQRLGKMWE